MPNPFLTLDKKPDNMRVAAQRCPVKWRVTLAIVLMKNSLPEAIYNFLTWNQETRFRSLKQGLARIFLFQKNSEISFYFCKRKKKKDFFRSVRERKRKNYFFSEVVSKRKKKKDFFSRQKEKERNGKICLYFFLILKKKEKEISQKFLSLSFL